jgi:hypothetical protein
VDRVGTCRLCLQHRQLIDSHIIPGGFFERIKTDEPNMLLNEKNYPKKSPKGVYDQNILCAPCDNTMGKWDHYAQQVLMMDMSGFTPIGTQERLGGWERHEYEYPLLKLFFISLAWRASISTHNFYMQINIGPKFEEKARLMLRTEDPGDAHDFGVVLARFTEPLGHAFLNPHSERMVGVNHIRFYVAGFVIYMKVDQRRYRRDLEHFLLSQTTTLRIQSCPRQD